jgi:AraC-like DNA-binding protein
MITHYRVPRIWGTKLEEMNVSVSSVLRAAGLSQDLFKQERILITTKQQFTLWRAIGQVAQDPAVGVMLGTEEQIARLHPIGLAALSAENLGGAVLHMARYKKLCAPEEISDSVTGHEWSIHYRWLLAIEPEPPTLMEYCFAWLLNIARKGTGTAITPLRVEFLQPIAHVGILERHFGCKVTCGAARNAIVFRASDALLPFITRNPELLDVLTPHFEQELVEQSANCQTSYLDLVRGAIQHRLTGHRPKIDDVARDLHVSSRSLQRKLQESGSSYQDLLDEARHQMARYYLSKSALELSETAYLLGYENTDSFARAFRSWEGIPPKSWRDAYRDTAVQ